MKILPQFVPLFFSFFLISCGQSGGISPDASTLSGSSTTLLANGSSWSSVGSIGSTPSTPVAYGNGVFVVLGFGNSTSATSSDGENWTTNSSNGTGIGFRGLAFGDGVFIGVGTSAGGLTVNTAYKSTNGVSWSSTSLTRFNLWDSIAHGGGRFVAVSKSSNISNVSTDGGVNWIEGTMPSSSDWDEIRYVNGRFFATINGSSSGAVSTDGITWSTITFPSSGIWRSVAFGNSKYVAVRLEGGAASSTDGTTWTTLPVSSETFEFGDIVFANDTFVAVGKCTTCTSDFGAITSSDGSTWQLRTTPGNSGQLWTYLVLGNNSFVANSTFTGNGMISKP